MKLLLTNNYIMDYKKIITLNHNEVAAKINKETGEIIEIKNSTRKNNIPEGKTVFIADEYFAKAYEKAWAYLVDNLSLVEIKIALKMSTMIEMNTNALNPLDDKTSIRGLSEHFGISINSVKKAFKHLFDIGVYASFRYSHYKRGIVDEWIFNPYISFKGKLIESDIKNLFDKTEIGKLFNKNR